MKKVLCVAYGVVDRDARASGERIQLYTLIASRIPTRLFSSRASLSRLFREKPSPQLSVQPVCVYVRCLRRDSLYVNFRNLRVYICEGVIFEMFAFEGRRVCIYAWLASGIIGFLGSVSFDCRDWICARIFHCCYMSDTSYANIFSIN